MKRYLIRLAFIGVYTLFHLFVLRGVRTEVYKFQMNEGFVQSVSESDVMSFSKFDTRLFNIDYVNSEGDFTWRYKMPFGHFFFLGIIGLIAVGAKKHVFYLLISFHAGVVVVASIIFNLDITSYYEWLYVTDFLSHYLIPLISIGIIPIAIFEKKFSPKVA